IYPGNTATAGAHFNEVQHRTTDGITADVTPAVQSISAKLVGNPRVVVVQHSCHGRCAAHIEGNNVWTPRGAGISLCGNHARRGPGLDEVNRIALGISGGGKAAI